MGGAKAAHRHHAAGHRHRPANARPGSATFPLVPVAAAFALAGSIALTFGVARRTHR